MNDILHTLSRSSVSPESSRAYSEQNGRGYDEGTFWEWNALELKEHKSLAVALNEVALAINQTRPRPHPTVGSRSSRPVPHRFLSLRDSTVKVIGALALTSQGIANQTVWRPCGTDHFSGAEVSVRHFREVLEWLIGIGYLEVAHLGSDFGLRETLVDMKLSPSAVRANVVGKATRWRTTERWEDFCKTIGVTPETVMSMFDRFPSPSLKPDLPDPVVVKASSKQSDYSAEQVEIAQRKPWFATASADMADYLDCLKQQTFEGLDIRDLHRQFREDGRYGRLHAAFQNRPRHIRNYLIESGRMRLNGNPVLYIDVASSWPTIIAVHYGLRTPPPMHSEDMHRLAASEPHDHYMPILSLIRQQGIEVTRDEVKEAMSAVIASKSFRGACERTRSIRRMVVEHSPALQLYLSDPTTDRDDLFLMESDALMMALLELKQFDIPAVPVHDALIIEDRPGIDTEHLACFALTRAYASIANARAVARVEVSSQAA